MIREFDYISGTIREFHNQFLVIATGGYINPRVVCVYCTCLCVHCTYTAVWAWFLSTLSDPWSGMNS